MNKIIYIGYQPITSKFYSDYFIGTCLESGLEVEYWDLSKIYFPKLNFCDSLIYEGTENIRSFRELKTLLTVVDVSSTVFIVNITYEYKVLRLFLQLSSFGCYLAFFGRGAFPSLEESNFSKVQQALLSLNLNRIITRFKNKVATLFKQLNIVRTYDLLFKAGEEGYKSIGFGFKEDIKKASIININYFDYDIYLTRKTECSVIKESYCVFLDEYLPYHPDFLISGSKSINPKTYYGQLNLFFDSIENKTNARVVIAAHPKANIYKSENPFINKEIIFNKTCELVNGADFVMTHYSSAISFAILFSKPILFLTSHELKSMMPFSHNLTLRLGKFLNSNVLNYDNFKEDKEIGFQVDVKKYNNYKYRYLTSKESENLQSSEIFINAISQL